MSDLKTINIKPEIMDKLKSEMKLNDFKDIDSCVEFILEKYFNRYKIKIPRGLRVINNYFSQNG
jgi:hypothetical protein